MKDDYYKEQLDKYKMLACDLELKIKSYERRIKKLSEENHVLREKELKQLSIITKQKDSIDLLSVSSYEWLIRNITSIVAEINRKKEKLLNGDIQKSM